MPTDRQRLHHSLSGLTRIFTAAVTRYRDLGSVRGNLRIEDLTADERLALAGFLGKHIKTRPGQTLVLPLAEVDAAFGRHHLAPGLLEAAALLDGQRIRTRAQEQAEANDRWSDLLRFTLGLSNTTLSQSWAHTLGQGAGQTLPAVHREFNQAERSGQGQHRPLRQALATVAKGLDSLPSLQGRTERLPVFAAGLTGDPHGLDEQTLAGRLFLRALVDCLGQAYGVPGLPKDALERGVILTAAGLLPDGVSSTVACFGLQNATKTDGSPDRQVEGAYLDKSVMIGSLRQVGSWSHLGVTGHRILAVENPAVFEELVDHMSARYTSQPPPLLCTSGFLSVAAVRVLDLAVRQGLSVAYGGDFDRNGLAIATGLLSRYGTRMTLWAMGVAEYRLAAKHPLAEEMSEGDRSRLVTYEQTPLRDLAAEMKRIGRRAYQEALLPLLKDDVG